MNKTDGVGEMGRSQDFVQRLPNILKDITEFKAIGRSDDSELDSLWVDINVAECDQFIAYATEIGISRWESILGITPKADESLEDRRFRVEALVASSLPYTYKNLNRFLTVLCGENGYEITRDVKAKRLDVRLGLASKSKLETVTGLLELIVPVNMQITTDLLYNTHETLADFTHEELESDLTNNEEDEENTHSDLRNEVLTRGEY